MKNLRFLMIALVAMFGFISCDKDDCNHYDHSADLVGTWTCFQENFAEALVISADGSMVATGLADGKYWEDVKGTITLKDGKAILNFEDNVTVEGHFDIIPGMAFSIVTDNGERMTFNYCANDLSDEIVGMWVCNESENGMLIRTFTEDGEVKFTGFSPEEGMYFLNSDDSYKVFGDVLFITSKINGVSTCIGSKISYSNDGTSLGDILVNYVYLPSGDSEMETTSWLRIKQHLELPGMKYDYSKIFVTNVKGEDKDIPFLNTSFNFAKVDGSIIDKFLKSTLFAVEFPDANTLKYSFLVNGQSNPMTAPIQVDGNKMTIKMSENGPFQDVEIYTFQDQDNTQMHLYMPTSSFEKFFANTSVHVMLGNGQLGKNDTEAIAAVYKNVADAVESINLSIVMTRATKSL